LKKTMIFHLRNTGVSQMEKNYKAIYREGCVAGMTQLV
jgi:hypothetical protein